MHLEHINEQKKTKIPVFIEHLIETWRKWDYAKGKEEHIFFEKAS